MRHVVLHSVADFDRAEIEVLMAATLKLAKLQPDPSAKDSVVIRAEAQKQRAPRHENNATGLRAADGEGPAQTATRLARRA